ncbi:hypothetical protein MSAN_00909400 [Mycena sanguinolenta]|uniref:F-box domain-containing protein n=1 Tax=Mycena sanguinolenta TaxID=230812 RepID=A0A8H7DCF9_9AGAR|nr:hypothetical protein MSAN_00909400 [Mycena sanguinolenta]
MFSILNSWLFPQIADATLLHHHKSLELPNEIWTHIFEEPSLLRRDLYSVFISCHHFNDLVLPILLCAFSETNASRLAAGEVTMPSDMLPLFNLAFRLPVIRRLTLHFDAAKRSQAPREFQALRTLVGRASSLVELKLNFPGDLLSSAKSADLVSLTPQRLITESFCDFLSSFSYSPDDPVVLVDTDVFSCLSSSIRSWQLDKYRFTDVDTAGGIYGFLQAFVRPQSKEPHRNKTMVKLHNGLDKAVFPFISIMSAHIQRIQKPFSTGFPSWTLAVLNAELWNWPNAVNLSSPLAAEEWAAILPLLNFRNLPRVRMDPPEGDLFRMNSATITSNIPVAVLDAFLDRHHTITRMYYHPDPLTLLDAPPFPYASLPRMRNITTTARCVSHLFHHPHAFPYLGVIRINAVHDPQVMHDAFSSLARHDGSNKLILELSSGSWMEDGAATVVCTLDRVDTVLLSGFTDFVQPTVILQWLGLFPALRRVGLQGCVHNDAGQKEQRDFPRLAREALPDSLEVIST